jgi:hypothetical protein
VTGRSTDPDLNIPTGAIAVTGNLTVTGQSAPGYLALTTVATKAPKTSTLNFPLGDSRATGRAPPCRDPSQSERETPTRLQSCACNLSTLPWGSVGVESVEIPILFCPPIS